VDGRRLAIPSDGVVIRGGTGRGTRDEGRGEREEERKDGCAKEGRKEGRMRWSVFYGRWLFDVEKSRKVE